MVNTNREMEMRENEVRFSLPKEARVEHDTWSWDTLVLPVWSVETLRDELNHYLGQ